MATTLTRNQTDNFYSQRTFTNESKTSGSTDGDWFVGIYSTGAFTNTQYNALVDAYNNAETDADNGVLTGTNPSGGHFSIASLPDRPRPIHK